MKNLILLLPILSTICFSCLKDIDEIEQVTSPFDPEYDTPYIDIEKIVIRDTVINQNVDRCYAKIYFKVDETSYNRMNVLSNPERIKLVMRNSSNQNIYEELRISDIEIGKTYFFEDGYLPCGTEVCRDFLYISEGVFLTDEYKTAPQYLDCFLLQP